MQKKGISNLKYTFKLIMINLEYGSNSIFPEYFFVIKELFLQTKDIIWKTSLNLMHFLFHLDLICYLFD